MKNSFELWQLQSSLLPPCGSDLEQSPEESHDENETPPFFIIKVETGSTVYTLTYGNFALQSSIKIGSRTLASYGYSADGNHYLTSLDYGNGDSVDYSYEYDASGRRIH